MRNWQAQQGRIRMPGAGIPRLEGMMIGRFVCECLA